MAKRKSGSIHVDTPEGGSIVAGQYSTDGSWFVMIKLSNGQWIEPVGRFTKPEVIGVQKFLSNLREEKLAALA
jgi:hypothetical protein